MLAGLLASHCDSALCCKVRVSFCFSLPLLQKKKVDKIQMSHCLTLLPAEWLLQAECGTAAQVPASWRLSVDVPVKMWAQMPSFSWEWRRRKMGDAKREEGSTGPGLFHRASPLSSTAVVTANVISPPRFA